MIKHVSKFDDEYNEVSFEEYHDDILVYKELTSPKQNIIKSYNYKDNTSCIALLNDNGDVVYAYNKTTTYWTEHLSVNINGNLQIQSMRSSAGTYYNRYDFDGESFTITVSLNTKHTLVNTDKETFYSITLRTLIGGSQITLVCFERRIDTRTWVIKDGEDVKLYLSDSKHISELIDICDKFGVKKEFENLLV